MSASLTGNVAEARRAEGGDARVSVVIPLYNHEAYIGPAIASVLSQSKRPAEIIVVDDGSSDGSVERMREICAAHPEIIFWSWPNQGAHHALNAAILRATGEFIAILNSDDCFHPHRLARCLAVVRAEPDVDLVATGVRVIDAQGAPVHNAWYEDAIAFFRDNGSLSLALFHGNLLVSTSNFFIRRSTFDRLGYFSPLRYAHDLEFVLRLVASGRRVRFIDAPLLDYRLHGRNTIAEATWRTDAERAAIFAFFLNEQLLRGQLSDADLRRHVAELERQHLADLVESFLQWMRAEPSSPTRKLPRRMAQAFLDFQRRLAIDWVTPEPRDSTLERFAQARRADGAQEGRAGERDAWARVAREHESRIKSLEAAMQELAKAKDWLAEQRDAWERTAGQHETQLKVTNAALEETTRAKEWLAGQRDAWERTAREQAAQLKEATAALDEVTRAKDWLAEQRDAWAREARAAADRLKSLAAKLEEANGRLAQAEAERTQLRANIEGLLQRRLFRLLLRLRLLKLNSTSIASDRRSS